MMPDPRKAVIRPEKSAQEQMRSIAHQHLLAVTEIASEAMGISGASFVVLGMGIWAAELNELDAKATSQMLWALSVIHDSKANHTKKSHAEKKRRAAVEKLFSALDIEMVTPQGNA